MRAALISAAAAAAVALLAFLFMRGGESPAPPEPAPAPAHAQERERAPDALEPAGDAEAPEESEEERAARALVERYRAAAEAARERVAKLQPASKAKRQPFSPYRFPPREAPVELRNRWNEHIAPLLYPPDHPRAGEPLDSVTNEQLAAAAGAVYDANLSDAYLDRPVHQVRLHVNFPRFHYLKELTGGGRDFALALKAEPPDPNVVVQEQYWIDTTWDDPDVETPRGIRHQQRLEQAEALRASGGAD